MDYNSILMHCFALFNYSYTDSYHQMMFHLPPTPATPPPSLPLSPTPLQPEVRGGHLLEEDGGGANVLGGAEAQDGSSPTDEPPWNASAPSTG